MIFVLAKNEPALFVLLNEQDVAGMRQGSTRFVDERQLKGETFSKVILGLFPSDVAALDAIRKAGNTVTDDMLVRPEPKAAEGVCDECGGMMPHALLNHGRCICCWRNMAVRLQAGAN
jgi:hypothetical protein